MISKFHATTHSCPLRDVEFCTKTNLVFWTQLTLLYHLEKTRSGAHRMLVKTYGQHALGRTQVQRVVIINLKVMLLM